MIVDTNILNLNCRIGTCAGSTIKVSFNTYLSNNLVRLFCDDQGKCYQKQGAGCSLKKLARAPAPAPGKNG